MIRLGVFLREEDESGVSGTGIVADIIEYPDGWCVAHWRSNMPSTNVYPNVKALSAVHGHGGKTKVVWIAEIDAPKDAEHLQEVVEELREEEQKEDAHERLVETVAEEVTERLKGAVTEQVAKTVARRKRAAAAAKKEEGQQ